MQPVSISASLPNHESRASVSARQTGLLVILLAVRLVLGIAYSWAIPLGEAPDEADHYAYAAYILQEGKLPVGPEMTQGKHPPLYHVLAAFAGKAAGGTGDRSFLRANPDMAFGPQSQASNFFVHTTAEDWPWPDGVLTMHAGRFVSVLAGLILVLAVYLLGRSLWLERPALALMAAAFAAFVPESLFVGGAMSNDMLAAMWATLALWLALYTRNWKGALFAGACLGLAFVSKASTGSLALIVGAALFVSAWPKVGRRWPGVRPLLPAAGRVIAAGVPAFLVAAPWLWRNYRLYGDPFGWPVVLATIDRRQGPLGFADVLQLFKGWWLSFWGKFGGAGHIPLPTVFYLIWAVLGLLALAGWIAWVARRRQPDNLLRETSLAGWIVLLGAPLVTIAGIYSYSKTALGTDQGRLLFPALGPLAFLIAGGVAAWVPERFARAAAVAFAGGMGVIALAALYMGLLQPYAPPPAPARADVAQAAPVGVHFGSLELIGTVWDQPANGELTLYWRATELVQDDLRTDLRLVDAAGNLLWEWKRSPGAGRFSTDRWPVGRVAADTYRPPADALARAVRVELGVRPFPEGPWLPAGGSVDPHAADPFLVIPR
jgi:4-amino-4-deoxy-L-arabinose transferase-like glycosyltransferase